MSKPTFGDPKSPQWGDCKACGSDHWTKDHQTVPQGTLDYGKGYSDGYRAALAQALAAIHDMDSVQLAFRGDPTKATAPAVYVALDAIVEILRSGPPRRDAADKMGRAIGE